MSFVSARRYAALNRPGRHAIIRGLGPILTLFCAFAPGCTPTGGQHPQASLAPHGLRHAADELWIATGDEPQSIDPALCNDSVGSEIITNLFAGLVEMSGEGLDPVPDLASAWTISADKRTYTFTLRPNRWSDGTPLTAHDFVYSLERVLDPLTACRHASMLDLIEGAQKRREKGPQGAPLGVLAVDDNTLRITLRAPTPYFLQFLSYNLFRPVPRHLMQRLSQAGVDPKTWTRPEHIVTSGAYVLHAWRFKRDYTLLKNANYWDADRVRLRKVWVQQVQSPGTTINLYRAGAIDWTGPNGSLPAAYTAALSRLPDYYAEPTLSTYFYWLNTKREPLTDVRVRRALSLSVDRRALVQNVLRGGQQPTTSLVPPGVGPYPAVPSPGDGGLDVAQAQRLMAEAGYGPQHPPMALQLIYNTGESHRQIAEALQAMWRKNLGIDVELQNQEWKVYQERLIEQDFHLARMGWVGDYADAYNFLQEVLSAKSGNNRSGWTSDAFEKLLQASTTEPDGAKRQQLMHDAEAVALGDGALMPLYVSIRAGLKHPSLQGLRPNIMDRHPYKDLYFDLSAAMQGGPS